jgi:calcium-dependent protein kinase
MSKPSDKYVIGLSKEPITNFYDFGNPRKQLGQAGQFGEAYLVQDKKDGQKYAVKIISKTKFRLASDRVFHFKQLRDEIRIMNKMDHKNIIKFHEVFEDATALYIVMECCSGGELFDRIKAKPEGAYSEADAAGVLKDILSGIQYMHQMKIAHCDLKPDNFLFLTSADDSPLKIIDFGMSKMVKRRQYLSSFRGTPYYVAPEVLDARYSEHCDMWSFGVIMFVMLFGYPPFHDNEDELIFKKVKKGFTPVTKKGYGAHFPAAIPCSDSAKDLIAKCLTLDTAARFTATEALEHPWLNGKADTKPMLANVLKGLSEFTANYKFKQAVLGVLTQEMSKEELDALSKTFQEIDKDGNGQITLQELNEAVSRGVSGVSVDKVKDLLRIADVDGDGELSYDELLMTTLNRKLKDKEERLWNVFCKLDLNGDGFLTLQEIESATRDTVDNIKEMIAEVDADGDGKVNYDEFVTMWMDKEEAALKKENLNRKASMLAQKKQ